MNNEIFMDIKGYEERYQISTKGRVWSIISQRYLQPTKLKSGYLVVHLTAKNGKKKLEYIHRLVALMFAPNPNHYTEVNHKDENKANNTIENLEWCSRSYNNTYGSKQDSVKKAVGQYDLQNKLIKTYPSISEAARQNNISFSSISLCCNGYRKTSHNYRWKFIENKGD